MSANGFETLDANQLGSGMARLHEMVVNRRSRIEITRNGCDERCVIITKQELDSLEEALGILAQTDEFKAMCAHLNDVVSGQAAPVRPQA
jgi:hypothetical protein